MLTYGDGLSDVNILELISYHKKQGKLATVTSIQPSGRFGALEISSVNQVKGFKEKPKGDGTWINGGFFVLEPQVIDYISDASTVFEKEPLESLVSENQLLAYKHNGFWQPMDTLRDKNHLEELWSNGNAPWKIWK